MTFLTLYVCYDCIIFDSRDLCKIFIDTFELCTLSYKKDPNDFKMNKDTTKF